MRLSYLLHRFQRLRPRQIWAKGRCFSERNHHHRGTSSVLGDRSLGIGRPLLQLSSKPPPFYNHFSFFSLPLLHFFLKCESGWNLECKLTGACPRPPHPPFPSTHQINILSSSCPLGRHRLWMAFLSWAHWVLTPVLWPSLTQTEPNLHPTATVCCDCTQYLLFCMYIVDAWSHVSPAMWFELSNAYFCILF